MDATSQLPAAPFTFRHGKVLMTINAYSGDKNHFIVHDAVAQYLTTPVALDLPLHYVTMPADSIEMVYRILSDSVRNL